MPHGSDFVQGPGLTSAMQPNANWLVLTAARRDLTQFGFAVPSRVANGWSIQATSTTKYLGQQRPESQSSLVGASSPSPQDQGTLWDNVRHNELTLAVVIKTNKQNSTIKMNKNNLNFFPQRCLYYSLSKQSRRRKYFQTINHYFLTGSFSFSFLAFVAQLERAMGLE